MQVNTEVPMKLLYRLRLIIGAALIVMIAALCMQYATAAKYEETTGVVTSNAHVSSAPGKSGASRRVQVSYEVDGHQLSCSFGTIFAGRYDEGSTVKIHYDPSNPLKIADPFMREALIVCIVFVGVFFAALLKIINVRENM